MSKTGMFDVSKSDYYRIYCLEKSEIEKNKYFLSEKLGRDCGYSYARWDWVWNHRDKFISGLKASGLY